MTDKSGEKPAYVAVDSDGIVKAICVDSKDERTAENVAEFIGDGRTVHPTTVAVARVSLYEPWPRIA